MDVKKRVESLSNQDLARELYDVIRSPLGDFKNKAEDAMYHLEQANKFLFELWDMLNRSPIREKMAKHAAVSQKIVNNQRISFKNLVFDKLKAEHDEAEELRKALMLEKYRRRQEP